MGVPAFFRWLSEKYPKTVIDMIEQRPHMVDGVTVPLDLTQPNPNNMEFDNLYIDMNGIIHPCSHPEDRPMPKTEAEMFVNVMMYVDRIFAAVRPRKVLFLAIDGVAPRAKMNQQRTRRFRSAGEARERHEIKMQTRQEMIDLGLSVPPEELEKEWDSNVITPGTEFMTTLAHYLRFYVAHRVNTNKAWQNIKVLFSDGSEPGEGEHKIMDYIRKERAQPGYDPNTRHILHGLDADLIMLALATHEPHFTILREQVFFGRRGRDAPQTSDAQRAFDAVQGPPAAEQVQGDHFPYLKPFQMLHIPTLREYLRAEFACLEYPGPGQLAAFPFDFERVVDDFVFICFFVGNDFLPHLPSLDIRDGAIDFLLNVYKRVLPALGDYLTTPGGGVNLEKVDVILAEVGRVEDEVFRRRYAGEEKHRARLEQKIRQLERRAGGTVQQLQDKMVPENVVALGAAAAKAREMAAQVEAERARKEAEAAAERARQKAEANKKNVDVAKALRASLRKGTKALKRERSQSSTSLDGADDGASLGSRSATPTTPAGGDEEQEDGATAAAAAVKAEPGTEGNGGEGVQSPKRIKLEAVETTAEGASARLESTDGRVKLEVSTEVSVTAGQANVEGGEDEDEDEDEVDEEEEEVKEELEKVAHAVVAVVPELEGTELAAAQKALAERVKAKQEAKLEKLRHEIEDTIRYHEAGWKDRYYADKLKKHNVEKGGGKAHMCRTYIEGLCWVFQYYYRGCQAWGWFYPFHYAPFASDLVNIEQYQIAFDLGTPLRPLEQLMAVLPPESADALPLPLARLMTAEDSPIKDFYPRDVEVDPNGKAMPWLWVTLLPFIDEGRLLETVRAAEAELSPVERKRNELGPSLLCLHEYHPSFRAVADVAGAAATADASSAAPLVLNAASHDGFSGTLSRPPPEAQLALGAPIPAPRNPPYALQDVDDNRALVAAFELPPQSTPHASTLLAGLQYPAARLTDRDKMPRRPPRLGRGLNIADLGMQFGFTEMHAHQRMIMHNMPRGGPPMMVAAHASQHHYHQGYGAHPPPYGMGHLAGGMGAMSVGATGNRSWGSLEPGVNQMKHPGGRGPVLPPPLMGMPGRPSLPRPALLVPPHGTGAAPPRPPPPPGYPPQPVGPPPLMPWAARGAPPSLYPQGGGGMAPGHPMLQPPRPYGAGAPPPPINIDALKQQISRAMAQRDQEAGSGGGGGGHHRQGGGGRLQPPHHGGGGGYRR